MAANFDNSRNSLTDLAPNDSARQQAPVFDANNEALNEPRALAHETARSESLSIGSRRITLLINNRTQYRIVTANYINEYVNNGQFWPHPGDVQPMTDNGQAGTITNTSMTGGATGMCLYTIRNANADILAYARLLARNPFRGVNQALVSLSNDDGTQPSAAQYNTMKANATAADNVNIAGGVIHVTANTNAGSAVDAIFTFT